MSPTHSPAHQEVPAGVPAPEVQDPVPTACSSSLATPPVSLDNLLEGPRTCGAWMVPTMAYVGRKTIAQALSLANEGGIGHWASGAGFVEPQGAELLGAYHHFEDIAYDFVDFPVNGGATLIREQSADPDSPPLSIDPESIQRGLEVMATKYPVHFHALTHGQMEKRTADVLVQCVVFGKIVYGESPYN